MDVDALVDDIATEQAVFAVGGVLVAGLALLAFFNGAETVELALFLSFSAYLLGAALPPVSERVPEYKRTGAMALGVVGVIAYLLGTSSPLPVLFVLGGGAALLRIF